MEKLEKSILENNKLIAEFMGIEVSKIGKKFRFHLPPCGYFKVHPKFIKYHVSWDWLMPVVEKIESIEDDHHGHFGVYISSNSCVIQGTNFRSDKRLSNTPIYFSDYTLENKIVSTYRAVVEFIKWYNNNK